jgi:hypothetical protein
MFGTTLEEILASQNEKFPELEIPWIQRELTSEIIRLGGLSTEGIFRLPGEIDRVNALRVDVEDYHVRNADDAHVACSLLKLWLREMAEPIFPTELTEEILNTSENKEESVQIVAKLSALTKSCLTHLIRFLQVFSKEEVRFSLSLLFLQCFCRSVRRREWTRRIWQWSWLRICFVQCRTTPDFCSITG